MPLRIEAVNAECTRYADSDGIRWRVLEIERKVLAERRVHAKNTQKKS